MMSFHCIIHTMESSLGHIAQCVYKQRSQTVSRHTTPRTTACTVHTYKIGCTASQSAVLFSAAQHYTAGESWSGLLCFYSIEARPSVKQCLLVCSVPAAAEWRLHHLSPPGLRVS